jgi:hypothetical protein
MKCDPKQPRHLRYVKDNRASSQELYDRVVRDAIKLCQALGYDINTVEFAVENGIPYAIDFLNPAPDADVHSVGQQNFDWVVENVAQLAIDKARSNEQPQTQYHWSHFLSHSAARSAGSQ